MIPTMKGHIWTSVVAYWHNVMELSHCQCVSMQNCQYDIFEIYRFGNLSTCQLVKVSICQLASSSICQYVNWSIWQFVSLTICQCVNLSNCQFVNLAICQFVNLSMGSHVEGWVGHWSPWELRLLPHVGLGLHVEGWVGLLVTLGASAVAICSPVCHEGLEQTGGRRRRRMRRAGFDIEF